LIIDSFISIRWRTAATFDSPLRRRSLTSGKPAPFLYERQQRRLALVVIVIEFLFILSLSFFVPNFVPIFFFLTGWVIRLHIAAGLVA